MPRILRVCWGDVAKGCYGVTARRVVCMCVGKGLVCGEGIRALLWAAVIRSITQHCTVRATLMLMRFQQQFSGVAIVTWQL